MFEISTDCEVLCELSNATCVESAVAAEVTPDVFPAIRVDCEVLCDDSSAT